MYNIGEKNKFNRLGEATFSNLLEKTQMSCLKRLQPIRTNVNIIIIPVTMDRVTRILEAGVQYYFPDNKVPPYNITDLKQELLDIKNATAEDYAFHFFVTFVPPIIRRMYPDMAQEYHIQATIPLFTKILTDNK